MRLFLRLREKLKSKSAKSSKGIRTPVSPTAPRCAIPDQIDLSEGDRGIVTRTLDLLRRRIPVNKEPPTGVAKSTTSGHGSDSSGDGSLTSSMASSAADGGKLIKASPSQLELCRTRSRSQGDLRQDLLSPDGSHSLTKSISSTRLAPGQCIPDVSFEFEIDFDFR